MTMHRPEVCEETTTKCHYEAKSFCDECFKGFCINHATYHEQNCPVTKRVTTVMSSFDEISKPQKDSE